MTEHFDNEITARIASFSSTVDQYPLLIGLAMMREDFDRPDPVAIQQLIKEWCLSNIHPIVSTGMKKIKNVIWSVPRIVRPSVLLEERSRECSIFPFPFYVFGVFLLFFLCDIFISIIADRNRSIFR